MKKLFSLALALLMVLSMVVTPAVAETKGKTTIALSHKGTVTLKLGETLKLTATVTPEAAVKWKSSKAKVARVNPDGLVTAAAEGTATITAKAGGKSAKVKIKVVDPYKPTKVAISQGKKVTINLGETLTLGAVLSPATAKATLKWKSSKAKIAKVDANGTVTALKEGTAKITVQTHNKKKATITVKVVDPYKPTGLSIAMGKKQTMTVGDTLTLTFTMKPATARNDLTYKSSNKKVATVDAAGNVVALQKGTAKITATSRSNKKVKMTITITVKAAPINRELSVYYGQNAKAVKSSLGLVEDAKNPYAQDGEYCFGLHSSSWKNSKPILRLIAFGPTKSIGDAIVEDITVNYQSGYTFFGVSCGMTAAEVDAALLSGGWTVLRKSGSSSTYYNSGRKLDLVVSVKDGKAESLNLYTHGIYG